MDTLVAMNAAALSSQMDQLKKGGLIIANSNGMDARNLRLAGLQEDRDLLGEAEKLGFEVVSVEITRLTKEALKDSPLSNKEKDRAKNMFTLGLARRTSLWGDNGVVQKPFQRSASRPSTGTLPQHKRKPSALDRTDRCGTQVRT